MKKYKSVKRFALPVSIILGSGLYSLPGIADPCTSVTDGDGQKHLTCTSTIYYYNSGEHGGTPLSDYASVTINTTQDASTSPLQGWAVYGNSSTYNFNELNIETSGAKADGIVTKNGASKINIDKLTIKTTGSSADGLNVGKESNGTVITVGDDAYIDAFGMGVRANSSTTGTNENLITLGKNAVIISHEAGSNLEFLGRELGTGYAVYAGNTNSAATGDARVVIGDNSTIVANGGSAHAVYANKGGIIELGSTNIRAEGTTAHGIYAEAGSKKVGGATVTAGSQVYLGGDTTINVVSDGRKFALYAKGADSQISSSDRLSGDSIRSVFTVDGDMKAETKGIIDLQMADNSRFTGSTNSLEYNAAGAPNTTTNGTINLDIAGANSIWNMTADSVLSNLTLTGATLRYNSPDDLSDPDAFVPKTLTVAGDYTGNGGHLIMNTVLNGDDSPTDKLLIKGNSAGTTTVSFVNIGGQGGLTILNGIEVITVDGISDGIFTQSGPIVAGAYDYSLGRGKNGNEKNWYLTSEYTPSKPDPEPEPEPEPEPKPKPDPDPDPEKPIIKPPVNPAIRPEAGGYISNLQMANTLFNVRLHDRLGETQYTDVLTGERKVTSLWLRNVAGHSVVKSGNGQLRTGTNRYVAQLGGDIAQWSDNDLNRYHIGLMAGYGRISGKTANSVKSTESTSHADGYSVGIYGTYYANEADKTGLYADSWVQYNWFKNRVERRGLAEEKYDSDGITLSAEAGYSFLINETQGSEGSTNRWYIQPKAQVTYMGVKMDTHTERRGTRVSATGEGNIQTRLGVRVYGLGQALQDKDNDRHFQPFAEINWLNNSKMTGVYMDDDHVSQSGTRNIGEIKVGVEGQLTRNADIWFNVAQQAGSDHYSDTQGMLGLKYRF